MLMQISYVMAIARKAQSIKSDRFACNVVIDLTRPEVDHMGVAQSHEKRSIAVHP
ncbi:MAG: hypothetical protein ACI8P3_002597 [Saprospiraceae bacterium]|jgi:hypothetical protein